MERRRNRVGQLDRLADLDKLPAPLEQSKGRLAIEPRGEPKCSSTPVEEIGGDRLRDHATPSGDLWEVEVIESVLDEQRGVALLQLSAEFGLIQIDDVAIKRHLRGGQQVLFPPPRRHLKGGQVLERLGTHRFGESLLGCKIRAEFGQDLTKRGLRKLGAVDGPEAPLEVIEAVVPGAELQRSEGKRIRAMPDSPDFSPAHPSKLTSCLAAARTSANSAGSLAWRKRSIGASSSRRVFVPKSQARAVFSSKLSTIMRTTL